MSVRYGKFEMPEGIKVDQGTLKPTFARFVAEPLERGFGHTVGNSLRRVMLGALEAPAVTGIRIEGVTHEYEAVEGIIEDMTHIVLNLKGALLRRAEGGEDAPARHQKVVTAMLEVTAEELKDGQRAITLGDLLADGEYEVVNPELVLFHVTQPQSRRVDLRISNGRGYVPSERLRITDKGTDEIVIDALYSPVRLVSYRVENTRVGQDTDYDRLILEVTTDGRITPQEALGFAAKIGSKHFDVFGEIQEQELVFEREELETNTDREEVLSRLSLRIGEIELSVRSTNCLNGAGIQYIGELAVMKESDMLGFRNFGKKSLGEIKAKLYELGLGFEMELAEHGITRENIVSVIEEYLAERQSDLGVEEAGLVEEEEGE